MLRSIDFNLLVRIHFIIVMIWWTGLAPWEFEFPTVGQNASGGVNAVLRSIDFSGGGIVLYFYFTEMCSGSKAGSYLKLNRLLYRSTLGLSRTRAGE